MEKEKSSLILTNSIFVFIYSANILLLLALDSNTANEISKLFFNIHGMILLGSLAVDFIKGEMDLRFFDVHANLFRASTAISLGMELNSVLSYHNTVFLAVAALTFSLVISVFTVLSIVKEDKKESMIVKENNFEYLELTTLEKINHELEKNADYTESDLNRKINLLTKYIQDHNKQDSKIIDLEKKYLQRVENLFDKIEVNYKNLSKESFVADEISLNYKRAKGLIQKEVLRFNNLYDNHLKDLGKEYDDSVKSLVQKIS